MSIIYCLQNLKTLVDVCVTIVIANDLLVKFPNGDLFTRSVASLGWCVIYYYVRCVSIVVIDIVQSVFVYSSNLLGSLSFFA